MVTEPAGGGTDRVYAEASYALAAGVEVEILTTTNNVGTAAIQLTGNELANTIYGNDGNNVLDGKGGPDALYGSAGRTPSASPARSGRAMSTRSATTSSPTTRSSSTTRCSPGSPPGVLAAGAFNTGAAATQADDRIIYNSATGALLFDADGNGAGAAVQFAILSAGLAMTASEFLVI